MEQFGLVTICPFQPRLRCWPGTSFRCSGLISGTSSGTSRSMRWFLELETTTCPACGEGALDFGRDRGVHRGKQQARGVAGLALFDFQVGDVVRRDAARVPGHGVR